MSDNQASTSETEANMARRVVERRQAVFSIDLDQDVEQACAGAAAARDAGWHGVEVQLPAGATAQELSSWLIQLTKRDCPVLGISAGLRAAAIAEVSALLRLAGRLSAQYVSIQIPAAAGKQTSHQAMFNFTHELLDGVRFEAERAGAALAMELQRDGWLSSPVEARDLADRANSWAVGVSICGDDAAYLGDALQTLTHRVHCVRVGIDLVADSSAMATVGEVLDKCIYRRAVCVPAGADVTSARQALAAGGVVP